MASREAMEESKATSRSLDSPLYHAPTLRPGIGSPRCPRCSAPLSKDLEASGWTIAPFMRESFAMIGTAAGGSVASFYAFNAVMPHVKKRVGGPIWWQFVVGLPPVLLFSVGCAGLAGGTLPALAQLAVSTYHTASASSHSAISGITMRVEERGTNSLMPQLRESSHPTPSQSSVTQKS
ncbi:hypothetical protein KC19_1G066000 [Ceratodon purpureus]|uniref:Uncharacterized protein n=1 Tax=Ceratodon purpureus TaxID=3225 RepID=A0A8T0J4I5_CERPU|nr:hypothetical protein KC19_1G066000 [Ceratodon purpureus]